MSVWRQMFCIFFIEFLSIFVMSTSGEEEETQSLLAKLLLESDDSDVSEDDEEIINSCLTNLQDEPESSDEEF